MRLGYAAYCLTVTPNLPKQSNLKPEQKLAMLQSTLEWNGQHQLFLLQLEPELIPIGKIEYYLPQLARIAQLIKKYQIRVCVKPTFLTTLISPELVTFQNSLIELDHLSQLMMTLGLDRQNKIIINIGGIYNDKQASQERFIQRVKLVPPAIQQHLALENDRLLFSLADCIDISEQTGLPVVFNTTNHYGLSNGESIAEAVKSASATWQQSDGLAIVIYKGTLATSLHKPSLTVEPLHFQIFYDQILAQKIDLLIDFKDKEKSLLKLATILKIPN